MVDRITVIGGGNGALAIAGDLALGGFKVNLFEFPEFYRNIEMFEKTGEIEVTGDARNGTAKLELVTSDIGEAIGSSDAILVCVPSYAQEKTAQCLASFIKEEQPVFLTPGSTGGSLVFSKVAKEKCPGKELQIGEISTLPYACRRSRDSGKVDVFLTVHKLYFAAFPAKNTDRLYSIFKTIYPQTVRFKNVLETGLNNGNPVTHAAACILNAGRIEYAKGEYYHYQEGITPSVARVIELVDRERLKICEALGFKQISTKQRILETGYSDNHDGNLYEIYTNSPAFRAKGPESLQSRYVTEDVPYGLVPWYLIGQKLGLDLPVIRSIIELASALLGENYMECGRTLKAMGLNEININRLDDYLIWGNL